MVLVWQVRGATGKGIFPRPAQVPFMPVEHCLKPFQAVPGFPRPGQFVPLPGEPHKLRFNPLFLEDHEQLFGLFDGTTEIVLAMEDERRSCDLMSLGKRTGLP
jgi:hypothetical protein